VELIEDITSNLDNNLVITGIFFDLKKAFDTIDHSILIDKLCHYGFRGIASSWIQQYLINRKQFVFMLIFVQIIELCYVEFHKVLYWDLF